MSADFEINTLESPGSIGEPGRGQLNEQIARPCSSSRVWDSCRATRIFPHFQVEKPKFTIHLLCTKNYSRHRKYKDDFPMVLKRSPQCRKSKRSNLQSPSFCAKHRTTIRRKRQAKHNQFSDKSCNNCMHHTLHVVHTQCSKLNQILTDSSF